MFDSMMQDGLIDQVGFENIRFNTGPYGKTREKAQKNLFSSDFSKDIFKGVNLDNVPPVSQLEDIWFYMNYHLNFKRLYKVNRPVKLEQQFKYVQNAADLVAPDDAFVMYFCGYMQKKVLGAVDKELIKRLEDRLQSSEYWRRRFDEFNLSDNHLKTGVFPGDVP